MEIVATDHAGDLAVMRIYRHQPGLDLGDLRQLDLESLGIVVNLFNDKLGEHTRFQFVLWSFAAATHICRSDNRFISPKPNANLVGGWINGHYEAFYAFAFFILVAVPIRVFISLEGFIDVFLIRQRLSISVDENVPIIRTPATALIKRSQLFPNYI